MSFDAAHAKQENMHESMGDEDAKEIEGQVQKARDGPHGSYVNGE